MVVALLLVILLCTVWTGCSSTLKERQGEPGKGEGPEAGGKYRAKYYNFDDVLVPGELNYKQKRSLIYETPQFKAGSMVFSKWRIDVESLIDFFTYNMEKDNWKLVNSYKGKESFLNFSKPDKTSSFESSINGTARPKWRSGSARWEQKRCKRRVCY